MDNAELMLMLRILQAGSAWQIGNNGSEKAQQGAGSELIFAEMLQAIMQAQSDSSALNQEQFQSFTSRQSSVSGIAQEPNRELSIEKLVTTSSEKYGVSQALIQQVIQAESGYNTTARSQAGAEGLMQLMPSTAASYGVSDSFDPAQNIDAGTHLLKDLLDRYQGNMQLALAAYNAGPGAVEKYKGVPPYQETQNYVRTILTRLNKFDLET